MLQRYTRGMLIRRPRQTKLLQSQRGGNRRPPPTPFETPIGSNDSGRKSFSILSRTMVYLYHRGRRRTVANVKSVLVTLVVGKLPMLQIMYWNAMLQILYWIEGGFRGVYLMTLLTSPSSLLTLMTHPLIQCVCL